MKTEHLSFSYEKKTILSDLSFELNSGIYGILGPNGSGKTTLIRCLAGVLSYDGTISEIPEKIGYLPQKFAMYRELRVKEAMKYYAALKNIPKAEQPEDIRRCLELTNLGDKADARIRTLSGGMLRRLGIAQALLGDPPVILVDEPTAGLDPEERVRFKNLIRTIEKDKCILISTHIVEDVEALCDRIMIMDKGRILLNTATEELIRLADGHVFEVDEESFSAVKDSSILMKDYDCQGEHIFRFLSKNYCPEKSVDPTLEDGYIILLHPEISGYEKQNSAFMD